MSTTEIANAVVANRTAIVRKSVRPPLLTAAAPTMATTSPSIAVTTPSPMATPEADKGSKSAIDAHGRNEAHTVKLPISTTARAAPIAGLAVPVTVGVWTGGSAGPKRLKSSSLRMPRRPSDIRVR